MNCRYLKIADREEAKALPRESWKLIKGKKISLLKSFEGFWIKADAIICQLKTVNRSTKWVCLYWPDAGGNWLFVPLELVDIYLPLKTK